MSAVLIDPRHIRFLYTTCSLLFGMFGFVLIGLGVNFVTSQGAEMWLERFVLGKASLEFPSNQRLLGLLPIDRRPSSTRAMQMAVHRYLGLAAVHGDGAQGLPHRTGNHRPVLLLPSHLRCDLSDLVRTSTWRHCSVCRLIRSCAPFASAP